MTEYTLTPIKVLGFLLFISILFSCSKDSDLLAEVFLLDEVINIEDPITNVTIDLKNGSFETDEDKTAVFTISNISNSASGKSTVVKNIIQPANGQITIEKDSIVRYLPNADFNGTDYLDITIEVTDKNNAVTENEVTLEVVVNPISDTVDDILQVAAITEMGINVLNNDTFKDKNNVIISNISDPSHGTVILNEDKSILYTPTPSATAESDTFNYTATVVHEDQTVSSELGVVKLEVNSSNSSSTGANLLFKSGFQGVTLSANTGDYQYITGTDIDTGYLWPLDIWGSGKGPSGPNGIHRINDDGGPAIDNYFENVIGHSGAPTNALFQRLNYHTQVTQTPYQINNIVNDPDEFYIKYWMKIDATSLSAHGQWRAIWEYKTYAWASEGPGIGFRAIAFIANRNGTLYWRFQGDDDPSVPSWGYEVLESIVPVPRDNWFQVEYYGKMSKNGDGRLWMKVNGQLIGDHSGANIGPGSDSMHYMMLHQLYGTSYPMYQWIDDIEIWDGVPY